MKRWKLIIVSALVLLVAGGLAVNLVGCVSDDAHAANLATAAQQEAKLNALHDVYEGKIAALTSKLGTLEEQSEEAAKARADLEAARVKLAEYAAAEAALKAAKGEGDKVAQDTKDTAQDLASLLPIPGAAVVAGILGGIVGDQRRRKQLVGLVKAIEVVLKPDPNVANVFDSNGDKLKLAMGEGTAKAVAKIRKTVKKAA